MSTLMAPQKQHPKTVERTIDNPGQYMLDNGMVFELNRVFFHPIGYSLTVNSDGEISLHDFSDVPDTVTFPPDVFPKAKAKWKRYWKEEGAKAHHLRTRLLGFDVQTHPDIRQQPNYHTRPR
jgi:hypothetical protein